MEKSHLVLIRKGNRPLDTPSSYRSPCILDGAGKLFEKVLDNRIKKFLDEHDELGDRQYGFCKKRSTIDTVNHLIKFVKANQPKYTTRMLTLDIKNAFNSSPWASIIDAMRKKDIPIYLCKLIDSYLSDRTLTFEADGLEQISVFRVVSHRAQSWGPHFGIPYMMDYSE